MSKKKGGKGKGKGKGGGLIKLYLNNEYNVKFIFFLLKL